jgi:thioredoxin reductase
MARALEASGAVDFMDLTLSTFYNLYLVGGSMHMPLGYAVPLSAGIKEAVRLPVFATGRINDPVLADKILAAGQADVIGMVRAQICDPFLARKAKEGRLEEIRYCVGDNQNCYGRVGLNRPIGCIQNPWIGNEKREDESRLPQTRWKKRIMVVGGGPAGMWAAKTAKLRGHDVTLYEKAAVLGGQVLIAMKGSGREELGVIIRNERNQLEKLKVPIVLNCLVTPEFAMNENPDAVIVATGSVPRRNPVPGCDGQGIYNVWQVLQGEGDIGSRVLIIDNDGGHQATSVAEFLAESGKSVHILTTAYYVGADLGPTQDITLYRQRAARLGITATADFHVIEIKGMEVHGIDVYSNEARVFSGFDTIVTAVGNQVQADLFFALKGRGKEVYRIGDCVSPRKIDMAVYEGYMAGRNV